MSPLWSAEGVEIPSKLSKAFDRNQVVFFCGAGVSVGRPARLPNFVDLTRKIVRDIGQSVTIDEHTQLDVILGQMDRLGGRVHLRSAEILASDRPENPLHRDLITVASEGTPRIVTTNYDLHFERAAETLGVALPVHAAPALPLGDKFTGLVHLHGKLPLSYGSSLVLTDMDFGEAYITRGWATEFLRKVFDSFTVVFVGYSAKDTVMRYLTRAMSKPESLFAMAAENSDLDSWAELDVTPITYPNPNSDHAELTAVFSMWAARISMDAVAKLSFVRDIAVKSPDGNYRLSDLRWILSDPELTGHWVNYAQPDQWTKRLFDSGLLDELFETPVQGETPLFGWGLAQWVASTLATDSGDLLIEMIAKRSGAISRQLWFHIWLNLQKMVSPTVSSTRLVAAVIDAPGFRDDDRLALLLESLSDVDPATADLVLEHFLFPRRMLATRRNWITKTEDAHYDFEFPGGDSGFYSSWDSIVAAIANKSRILATCLSALANLEAQDALLNSERTPNWASVRRNEIASAADHNDGAIDRLVHLARDLLRAHTERDGPELAMTTLSSSSEILRRLGLDGLSRVSTLRATEIVSAVRQRDLLFDIRARPEVFAVLRTHFASASEEERAHIVHVALESRTTSDGRELRPYENYNLIVWLNQTAPEDRRVKSALRTLLKAHPGYAPRDRPDLNISFGPIEEPHYEPVGAFTGLAANQVVWRLKRDSRLRNSWDSDAPIAELRLYMQEVGSDSASIVAELSRQGLWSVDVWHAALAHPRASNAKWLKSLCEAIARHPNRQTLAWDLQQILTTGALSKADRARRMRACLQLWDAMPHRSPEENESLSSWANAHPRSALASAFLRLMWEGASLREPQSLGPSDLTGLSRLCDPITIRTDPTFAMVARDSRYLVSFAPAWFDTTLANPLIRQDDSSTLIWLGILGGMGWNDKMHARFSDLLRIALPTIRDALPDRLDAFRNLHAGVFANYADTDLVWADAFYIEATEAMRVAWLRGVASAALDDPTQTRLPMLSYWKRRTDGLPGPISPGEQSAFLGWLDQAGPHFGAMAECFVAGPELSSRNNYINFDTWPLRELPEPSARAMLRLITSSMDLPNSAELMASHATYVATSNPELALALLNELLRRGYEDAAGEIELIRARSN